MNEFYTQVLKELKAVSVVVFKKDKKPRPSIAITCQDQGVLSDKIGFITCHSAGESAFQIPNNALPTFCNALYLSGWKLSHEGELV